MSEDSVDSREQGIEFGSLAEELEDESYPLSHDELLSRHGDRELELADSSTSLRDILGPENEQEYEDAESVRQAIFSMVGDDAVGRKGYSDRGGTATETDEEKTDESF
ncbi:hypothetical protein HUB97_13835 [Halorubraceae archaeon YAN]|nr:hypothetical protein [Halorubraceae archaeon YAN]